MISFGHNAAPESAEAAIVDVFRSGQYSPGPRVRQFEEEWARLHKAEHAVFVNSGTDALRLSLLAMKEKYGWSDGAKVAVPALTFVATVNVILQANLRPYFVDVGKFDYCINSEGMADEDLVAVIPVHLFGQSCGPDIYALAKKRNLKVLEDSCETILNPIKGDASCHSTYMAHHVTTGVGGFAATDDEFLMWKIRSYANHGRNTWYVPGYTNLVKDPIGLGASDDLEEHEFKRMKHRFQFDRVGYSCRGTEFEAALGLSQLSGLEDNVLKRQLLSMLLKQALGGFEDLVLPQSERRHTFMMFPIVLKETSQIDKFDLCSHLERSGIETREMMPITKQPCYKGLVNENDYPIAQWINEKGFYIPCHPGMGQEEVQAIKSAFEGFLTKR